METTTYNNRLQPTQIQAGSLLTLNYGFYTSESDCQGSGTGGKDGTLLSQTITAPGASAFTQ